MAFGSFATQVARYNSALPTNTSGDVVDLQTDVNGRLLVKVDQALPTGSNTIGAVNQGTPTTAANAWPVKFTDGSNLITAGDNANNAVRVNGVAGAASSPSKVDDAAFTIATDTVSPMGALADETTPDSVDEGDVGLVRMSLNRNLYMQIRDLSAERSASVTAANALKVDGSAVTQPVSGTVTANAGTGTFTTQDTSSLVDNAGFTDGTSRVLPSGYIFDEVAGTALTENDVAAARINANRAQVHVFEDGATRGRWATVTAANAVKVDGSAVTQPVSDAGSSLTIDNATLSVVGGGTEATALRVTIANDSTGLVSIDDNGGSLTVDGTVAVSSITTSVTPGTAATNLGKAESAAHTSGDVGVEMLAVRQDTATGLASNGQYIPLITDATGKLWVNNSLTPDYETGTEADTAADSGGSGDGTVAVTGSMTDIVVIPHTSGTYYITAFDATADEPAAYELIVQDNDTTLIETIRAGILTGSAPSIQRIFPRAIAITGAAGRDIKLRAKVTVGSAGEVGGGINGYTR